MKRGLGVICLALALPSVASAAGFVQHQFMAELGADGVTTEALTDCLVEYRDAYLIGATFPDTGWVVFDDPLGNDTHSRGFIDAFVDHIRATYAYPYVDRCQLISFMMGVAAHVTDDPLYHGGMVPASAEHDFHGNEDVAHAFCDGGLDLVNIVEFNRWEDIPEYWIPVWDVQQVYTRMGASYPRWEIIGGNILILIIEEAERWVAQPLYLPLKRIMPWSVANYYIYADGGLYAGGQAAAETYETRWAQLMLQPRTWPNAAFDRWAGSDAVDAGSPHEHRLDALRMRLEIARRCLEDEIIEVGVVEHGDGSVTLRGPRVLDPLGWEAAVEALAMTYLQTPQ